MGIISRLMGPRNNKSFDEPFWRDLFSRYTAKSGKFVNVRTALEVATVFACLRVIAEGVSQVPLKLFRERSDGGSDPAKDHPLFRVLYRRPNSWQTSFEFRESIIFHAGLAGDFFAFKNRVRGNITELIPLEPGTVTVYRSTRGILSYRITTQSAQTSGEDYSRESRQFDGSEEFPAESIWHVRGPSWNTWMGLPAVEIAREAIGLAMATEEAHALLHANGAQTSGLYSVEGTLDEKAYERLARWIDKHIAGSSKFKPFVLDHSAKFTPISMTGVDSQHIETRKHQVEEVCRAFRVMPIMIGQSDKASTYASAEQMFLAHVVHTLTPWYERIEQSIDANLLTREEQDLGLYAKFLPNGLMRGAAKDRAEFYYKLWQMGALNPNEMRSFEEMNPYEGGDKYYIGSGTTSVEDMENQSGEGDDNQPTIEPFRRTGRSNP